MSHVETETAGQPECWRRAEEVAADRAAVLPATGERVAVVGCGTSYYMAQAYASLREDSGQGSPTPSPRPSSLSAARTTASWP